MDSLTRQPRSQVTSATVVLAAAVVLVGAGLLWFYVPDLYTAPASSGNLAVDATREATRSQAIVTTRASVLAALAGLGALITIGINYRNSLIARDTLATTNQTFRITERGHLTDRYTKAIEQLGHPDSLAIRLGGIYALQQFATETGRIEDHNTVVEVLSAFVRTNLPRRPTYRTGAFDPQDETSSSPPEPTAPPADILAAISALAQLPDRKGVQMRTDFAGVDFTNVSLTQARLVEANLEGVLLPGAYLDFANLTAANLKDAFLYGVSFHRASFYAANLIGAYLYGANFYQAVLSRAYLNGAYLDDANLSGAHLDDAHLNHAELNRANLRDARLNRADLRDARLRGAHLNGADLRGAHLNDARLISADLTGARLAGADLTGAHLTGADLTGVDLSGVDLTGVDLSGIS